MRTQPSYNAALFECLEAVDVNDDSMSLQNIMQGKD
jgi:hypothetical protein